MQHLKDNNIYILVHGDKNCGPCILEQNLYINKAFLEHFGNNQNYKQLIQGRAFEHRKGLQSLFRDWIGIFCERHHWEPPVDYTCISEADIIFPTRALKYYADKLARFRQTCKIHKNPWKMSPIICCAGTFMNYWSKWLDFWLQK